MNHSIYSQMAKDSLAGMWGAAFVATLIISVINSISSGSSYGLLGLLIYGPMMYGYIVCLINIADNKFADYGTLFSGFNRYVDTMAAGALVSLLVAVGCVFLIVPGIILALGFSMTFYIMAEDPNISGLDAMKRSWNMMNGYKMDLFLFYLGFIGWYILSILTCGIGVLFLMPYVATAQLYYYRHVVRAGYDRTTPPPFSNR